jgi:hypothetical protein
VCWETLKYPTPANIVCRQLGYHRAYKPVGVSVPTNAKDATFSGSIYCDEQEKSLSQCSIHVGANKRCSALSNIECKCS